MLEDVIFHAIREKIVSLPPDTVGIRTHALPTTGKVAGHPALEALIGACERLRADDSMSGCEFVVGSDDEWDGGTPASNIRILRPDAAAAEATRLRNDREFLKRAAGVAIVYANVGDPPGEAGLDGLAELTPQEIAYSYAKCAQPPLPLLAAIGLAQARPLRDRLADCDIEDLASYAAKSAAPRSELYALPILRMIPSSHEDRGPAVRWAQTFEALIGTRLENGLEETAGWLNELRGSSRARADEVLRPLFAPGAVREGEDCVAVAVKMSRAAAAFAAGRSDAPDTVCGLTARLLGVLKRRDRLAERLKAIDDPDAPRDPDDEPEPGEVEVSEAEAVRRFGAVSLARALEIDEDCDGIRLGSDESPESTLSVSPDREDRCLRTWLSPDSVNTAVDQEHVPSPEFWLQGGALMTKSEPVVLAPARLASERVERVTRLPRPDVFRYGDGVARDTFLKARRNFIAAATNLYQQHRVSEEDEEDDGAEVEANPAGGQPDLTGLLLLERYPLTTVAQLMAEAEEYVDSYQELLRAAKDAHNEVRRWVLNLDVLFSVDHEQRVTAARLLPLHPLRIARSRLWLEVERAPPPFPRALLVLWIMPEKLVLEGKAYCYHRSLHLRPNAAGIAGAVRLGVRDAWTLLRPRGLSNALEIELRDLSDPTAAVDALCLELQALFDEDADSGPVYAHVVGTSMSADVDALTIDRGQLGESSQEIYQAEKGAGVSVHVESKVAPIGRPRHLVIREARPTFIATSAEGGGLQGDARLVYRPSNHGNIAAIEVTGVATLDAYADLLRSHDVQPGVGLEAIMTQPDFDQDQAIVQAVVARGGWPLAFEDTHECLFGYDIVDNHFVVTLARPGVLETCAAKALAALNVESQPPVRELRKAMVAIRPCRGFFGRLLGQVDPRHVRADLTLLQAFIQMQREQPTNAHRLVLSLDTVDGRRFSKLAGPRSCGIQ